jgi:exopolyphosphatase / guanosine-5'-triphosphate,3'-diphosphate pyrophosphatase
LNVSVIDLGYNSLKLVNYNVKRDKSFATYGQESILARLGEGLDETGFLGDQPIRRTIKALKLIRDIVELQPVDQVLPIATSAVREAGNKDQFLQQVAAETGYSFKVLSEREEAIYSFVGAKAATYVQAGLFFDLGGGSLEMALFENYRIKKILSLPIGGLRLTDLYAGGKGSFSEKNYSRMRKRILELLPNKDELPTSQKLDLVGVGGTVRTLARFDQIRRGYPLNKVHNYSMKKGAVESIHQTLHRMKLKDIKKIPSIGQDRSRSIVAGSLVVELLMERMNFRRIIVSTHGLRDGVLLAYLEDPASYRKGSLESFLNRSQKQKTPQASPGRKLVESLFSAGVLTKKEHEIIIQALEQIPYLPLYNPETLFYVELAGDSALTHADQIIMSLSLAHAQGMKRTDWVQSRYEDLLDDNADEEIERMSALIKLLGLLEKTRSTLTLKFKDRKRAQLGLGRGTKHFPEEFLKDTLKDFQNAFGLEISQ